MVVNKRVHIQLPPYLCVENERESPLTGKAENPYVLLGEDNKSSEQVHNNKHTPEHNGNAD